MSAGQRTKGHTYERKIANFYRELGYDSIRRGSQGFGGLEPDVCGTDFWVECAHYARGGLVFRKFKQAMRDRDSVALLENRPVVVHVHETNGEDLVVVSLKHWKELVKK
jgi:hypothetical protein